MSVADMHDRPHALYRFFSSDGKLLYIGITVEPWRRWKEHASTKPWWHEVAKTTIKRYPTRSAALAAERAAIIAERPRYNVTHNKTWIRRQDATAPAWLVWFLRASTVFIVVFGMASLTRFLIPVAEAVCVHVGVTPSAVTVTTISFCVCVVLASFRGVRAVASVVLVSVVSPVADDVVLGALLAFTIAFAVDCSIRWAVEEISAAWARRSEKEDDFDADEMLASLKERINHG